MKNKDKQLLETCLKFIDSLQQRKFVTPYHYLTTKELKDGQKVPGLINAAELSAHVLTSDKLGRETQLSTNGDKLSVSFVEKSSPVPYEISQAIFTMRNPALYQTKKEVIKSVKRGRK